MRQSLGELTRALSVLALIFLSFGHQPVSTPSDLALIQADITGTRTLTLFCGDAPSDSGHGPCHACRVGGAALPPDTSIILPLRFAGLLARTIPTKAQYTPVVLRIATAPRAPPFA